MKETKDHAEFWGQLAEVCIFLVFSLPLSTTVRRYPHPKPSPRLPRLMRICSALKTLGFLSILHSHHQTLSSDTRLIRVPFGHHRSTLPYHWQTLCAVFQITVALAVTTSTQFQACQSINSGDELQNPNPLFRI